MTTVSRDEMKQHVYRDDWDTITDDERLARLMTLIENGEKA